ncbi:hypothetical protein, partial [Pseudomonas syringae group genomosp. 7]|uniref:hypothetical protein n=1 Tax=Pseudomonas syringae group genomosp. 7 TaxID=251699 RepID=UPI00376F6061
HCAVRSVVAGVVQILGGGGGCWGWWGGGDCVTARGWGGWVWGGWGVVDCWFGVVWGVVVRLFVFVAVVGVGGVGVVVCGWFVGLVWLWGWVGWCCGLWGWGLLGGWGVGVGVWLGWVGFVGFEFWGGGFVVVGHFG